MIKTFLRHGHLLKESNNTHITLILKKDNLENVSNYRSISLCNVSYKFIMLTKCLRVVVPKVISPLQSACVLQRDTHDNVLIASNVARNF